MVGTNPNTDPFFAPASFAEVQEVAKLALHVWEHPALQEHVNPDVLCQTVVSGFQPIDRTDIALTFTLPSHTYPDIDIVTEETIGETHTDEDLIVTTNVSFMAKQFLLGLPKYQAKVIESGLSIVNNELPTDEAAEVLVPKPDSWLTRRQRKRIIRGRQKPERAIFSQYHAVKLAGLLREFNPGVLLDIVNETFEQSDN